MKIDQAISHLTFNNRTLTDDIGLIRLAEAAKIEQNNIGTICLPFDAKAKRASPKYEVIGWGKTTDAKSAPVLQRAFLPEFDSKKCEEKYASQKLLITEGQICAGGEGKIDSCQGNF